MAKWPQGLWAVTPEGKVLAFHYHKPKSGESYAQGQRRWVDDTIQMIRDGIKEAGPLDTRVVKVRPDPLADRGRGVSKDGGARFAVSVVAEGGPPVVDSIHLNAEDWTAFSPKDGKATTDLEWTLPQEAARKFTPALSPMTDPIFSPRPDDAKTAKITAKIIRVEGGVAVIRYTGEWETFHNRDGDPKFPIRSAATGEGIGVFDTQKGKLTNLVWVLKGSYCNSPPAGKWKPTAAVIEWTMGN
jgi:hypothetical protein